MDEHYQTAKRLTKLLDSQFGLGKFRFGLDPIIGLVPGIGDLITLGLSLYIFWIGWRVEIPFFARFQMFNNIMIDFLLGIIPIVGDISDFQFKANSLNLVILEKYLKNENKTKRKEKVVEGEVVFN